MTGSLACCSPWGHRVGRDWVIEQQQSKGILMCFFFKTEGIPITIQIYPLAPIDCVSFPFSPCLQSSHILWCLSQTDSEFAPRENFFTITHMTSLLHCGSNRERSICCSIYLAHSMCSIKIHLLNKKQGTGHFHTGKHGN